MTAAVSERCPLWPFSGRTETPLFTALVQLLFAGVLQWRPGDPFRTTGVPVSSRYAIPDSTQLPRGTLPCRSLAQHRVSPCRSQKGPRGVAHPLLGVNRLVRFTSRLAIGDHIALNMASV
jgi:hypothetical protein